MTFRQPKLAGQGPWPNQSEHCGALQAQPSKRVVLRAALNKPEGETQVDIEQITRDLQDRVGAWLQTSACGRFPSGTVLIRNVCKPQWDKVENKTSVAVYAAGAVVALWLSSTIVGAVNAVPLVSQAFPCSQAQLA